jgi:hypothetical protein
LFLVLDPPHAAGLIVTGNVIASARRVAPTGARREA